MTAKATGMVTIAGCARITASPECSPRKLASGWENLIFTV